MEEGDTDSEEEEEERAVRSRGLGPLGEALPSHKVVSLLLNTVLPH